MILFKFFLPFLFVASCFFGVLFATPALSFSTLSDEELDKIGAGGETLGGQAPEGGLQALSDTELDHVAASAFQTFIWPFQYVPKGVPRLLRTVRASDGRGGFINFPVFNGSPQGRTPPPLPPQR